MKKNVLFLTILILFISCNFNANFSSENEESDKSEALSIAGFFYLHMANKSHDSILNLMSNEFYKVTSKDEFIKFLKNKDSLLGDYKDMKLLSCKTLRVSGTNPKTEYYLIFKIRYSRRQVEENISMINEKGLVKIIGYSINTVNASKW